MDGATWWGYNPQGHERVRNDLAKHSNQKKGPVPITCCSSLSPAPGTHQCAVCLHMFACFCILYKLDHEIYGLAHVVSVSERRVFGVSIYTVACVRASLLSMAASCSTVWMGLMLFNHPSTHPSTHNTPSIIHPSSIHYSSIIHPPIIHPLIHHPSIIHHRPAVNFGPLTGSHVESTRHYVKTFPWTSLGR